jgi:hypothetical protein
LSSNSSPPPNKALQLTSAGEGVTAQRRPLLASLAGRLEPSGGGARWATVSGQRRSQLSADPLGSPKSLTPIEEEILLVGSVA